MKCPILSVEGLTVAYSVEGNLVTAVMDASFQLHSGSSLGVVGESGSGKSTLARAIFGALAPNGEIIDGKVKLNGENVTAPSAELEACRWKKISFVPQAALASLDPLFKIGRQLSEIYEHHLGLSTRVSLEKAIEILAAFDLPERTLDMYPHELSGGMKQRVIIAAALALKPQVLIADEPTTALDTLVQRKVFDKFDANRQQIGASLILVTHDIGLVAEYCEDILIMRDGRIVEQGSVANVLSRPQHEYTRTLLEATPSIEKARRTVASAFKETQPELNFQNNESGSTHPLLEFRGISRVFNQRGSRIFSRTKKILALDDISFSVHKGEVLGIIGASGSGKTTIANIALGLDLATVGAMLFDGLPPGQGQTSGQSAERRAQMIFQNPYESLNPIYSVEWIVSEPIRSPEFPFGKSVDNIRARVLTALDNAGLKPADAFLNRRLHQLSGGQRQRVAIARAIIVRPELIIADEPVSMLDVSIRASVLETLRNLITTGQCGMIYITHDLATVGSFCDRLIVLRSGKIVESGDCMRVLTAPQSDYTRELLDAIPCLDPRSGITLRQESSPIP